MPIECNVCKTKARTVFFRSYSHYPRQVKNLWWLVLVAAIVSTFNALKFLVDLMPLLDVASKLRENVRGIEELGIEYGVIGDVSQFLLNSINYLVFVSIVVVIYLPVRYGLVLKRFRRGQPTTYWDIRGTAKLTIVVALFMYITVSYLFSELQAVDVAPRLGLNIAVAPLILLQMRRREVQEYFSQFNWVSLPPVEPKAATFLPADEPVASGWERVP